MFRYLALSWDTSDGQAASLGRGCAASLQTHPAWQQVVADPRLQVFITGARAGVNQAYPLPGGAGVALGRLFDRQDRHSSPWTSPALAGAKTAPHPDAPAGLQWLLTQRWGRYVAFIQAAGGRWQVLRDPSGALPCYQLHHGGLAVVFSWMEDVLALLPLLPVPEVSAPGLAAFLAFGELTGPRTALQGVTQVLAGQCVALDPAAPGGAPFAAGPGDAGRRGPAPAWDAADLAAQPCALRHDEAIEVLRESVQACTQAWASCYDSILLRLSGGFDSSVLASCLSKAPSAVRLTALNYHSVGARSDERSFARMAAGAFGLNLIERERDSSHALELVFDVARMPVPSHYIGRITSRSDAELARAAGATAMFTGAGGDQLFLEIHQWWPAADYLRLRGLDRGFLAAAADAARLSKLSVWRVMGHALHDLRRRRPPPQDAHRHRRLISDLVRQQAARPEGSVHPVFTEPSKLPIGKLMQVQQLAYGASTCDPYAPDEAPELVRPLLSQPLIEMCLQLPTFVLTAGGQGRGLARRAFAHALPAPIVERRSKGGMEEHITGLLSANAGFVRQRLLDGELMRRGLLDRAATEKALSARTHLDPALAGEVHFCLAAEAWLHSWSRTAAGPRPHR